METKAFQILDRMTCIPAIAVRLAPTEAMETAILRRLGFEGPDTILLCYLASERAFTDPYRWADRTMKNAHLHIEANWPALQSGDVVDVEYILGEVKTPKASAL